VNDKAGFPAGLFNGGNFAAQPFIRASQNKVGGTGDMAEPVPAPFVVGAGNETPEERFDD
jgi:hypothetical protein